MTNHPPEYARVLADAYASRPDRSPVAMLTQADIAHILDRLVPVVRAAALERAAKVAAWAHMVPPDGGSPTKEECEVAEEAARQIRALIRSDALDELGKLDGETL